MSNELALPNTFGSNVGHLAGRYAGTPTERLGEGVSSGYAIMSPRGKAWHVRYGGDETTLMREDGDGPRNSIEVVIVKSANSLSRIYYANGYVNGSDAPPDCMSNNGITPSANATNKQAASCAVCPRNVLTTNPKTGKPHKECANSKRLAIVPLQDLANADQGGPMLLRVPGASLTAMKAFGDMMVKYGMPYYFTYGVRISFDAAAEYPKFVFAPVRPLTKDELDVIDELRENPDINRILAEDEPAPLAAALPQGAGVPWTQSQNQAPTQSVLTTGVASTPTAPTAATTSPIQTPSAARASLTTQKNNAGAAVSATPTASPPSSTISSPNSNDLNLDDELDALMGAE